jgi:hypothetical protein
MIENFRCALCFSKRGARKRRRSSYVTGILVSPNTYLSKAVATSVALWPPKPKELLKATRTFFSRATFGV